MVAECAVAGGGTPLCRHIREVAAQIQRMEPQLRQQHQRAAVIIVTGNVYCILTTDTVYCVLTVYID
jgi:hypothetical protein